MELVLLHGVLCDVRVEAREYLIATIGVGGGGSDGGLCGERGSAPATALFGGAARRFIFGNGRRDSGTLAAANAGAGIAPRAPADGVAKAAGSSAGGRRSGLPRH